MTQIGNIINIGEISPGTTETVEFGKPVKSVKFYVDVTGTSLANLVADDESTVLIQINDKDVITFARINGYPNTLYIQNDTSSEDVINVTLLVCEYADSIHDADDDYFAIGEDLIVL